MIIGGFAGLQKVLKRRSCLHDEWVTEALVDIAQRARKSERCEFGHDTQQRRPLARHCATLVFHRSPHAPGLRAFGGRTAPPQPHPTSRVAKHRSQQLPAGSVRGRIPARGFPAGRRDAVHVSDRAVPSYHRLTADDVPCSGIVLYGRTFVLDPGSPNEPRPLVFPILALAGRVSASETPGILSWNPNARTLGAVQGNDECTSVTRRRPAPSGNYAHMFSMSADNHRPLDCPT